MVGKNKEEACTRWEDEHSLYLIPGASGYSIGAAFRSQSSLRYYLRAEVSDGKIGSRRLAVDVAEIINMRSTA